MKESWKLVEERHQEEKAALEKLVLELRSAKQNVDAERLALMTENSTFSQQIQELQNALASALHQNQVHHPLVTCSLVVVTGVKKQCKKKRAVFGIALKGFNSNYQFCFYCNKP